MNKNGFLPYQFFLAIIVIMILYFWYGFIKYQNNTDKGDLYLKGLSYAVSGSLEIAGEEFENILKTDSDHTGAKIGKKIVDDVRNNQLKEEDAVVIFKGLDYGNTGDWDMAVSEFNKAAVSNSRYANIYFIRGVAYYHQGLYDNAISSYNKAIEIFPQFYDAYFNKGVIYENTGKIEEAIKAYNDFIRCLPKKEIVRILRMKEKVKSLEKLKEKKLFPTAAQ